MRFLLVVARVQNFVANALALEIIREQLRFLDRYGADQNRLPDLLLLLDRRGNSGELVIHILVEFVVLVCPLDGQDGRRSEEHTSELQSLMRISYAGFCLKKKIQQNEK